MEGPEDRRPVTRSEAFGEVGGGKEGGKGGGKEGGSESGSSACASSHSSRSHSQSLDSSPQSPSPSPDDPVLHLLTDRHVVVRHCDHVDPEPDLLIDTEALHQRYRFFEEYREPEKERKRFIMTPPREVPAARSPDPTPEPAVTRDPNVVRCSDVVDDLPKTDTAKKMLTVFKRLESIGQETTVNGQSKPTDVIPVEPEMARSLRAKFENWTVDAERDNNNKSQNGSVDLNDEYTPQLDTTRKMLTVFQQLEQSQVRYCCSVLPLQPPDPRSCATVTAKHRSVGLSRSP